MVLSGVTRPKLIVNALERAHKNEQERLKEADPSHVWVLFYVIKQLETNRIQNFLSYEKKKQAGPGLELGQLSQWCKDNSNVPADTRTASRITALKTTIRMETFLHIYRSIDTTFIYGDRGYQLRCNV